MSFSVVVIPCKDKPYKLDIERKDFNLDFMHELVHGYIEVVNVNCIPNLPKMFNYGDLKLVVDDEGLYKKDYIYNKVASFIYGGNIVGDAFICLCGIDMETCEQDLLPMSSSLSEIINDVLGQLYLKLNVDYGRLLL